MYEDKTLVCKDCGAEFVFTAGEQEFYAEKGFQNEPSRCKACRMARKASAPQQGLTLYSDDQCPFIPQKVESIRTWCADNAVPISIVHVDTLDKAKSLPCVFNNWALLLDGKLVSVNLMDASALPKLLKK